MLRLSLIVIVILAATHAVAVPVTMDFIRDAPARSFNGVGVDHATGEIYERAGYNGESGFNVYANYSDFAAGSVDRTLSLNGSGFYGTYAGVRNGKLFGRSAAQLGSYSRWDLNSMNQDATTNLGQFAPQNGIGTFNWGGYSGLNTFTNEQGAYVVGRDAGSSAWRVERLDENLNASTVGLFGNHPFGYGFMIGNYLFMGDSFNSNQISLRYNVATGIQEAVNFTLSSPLLSSVYWSNFAYDSTSDTLIGWNTQGRRYFGVSNAAAAFGVPLSVPEPGTLSLGAFGLLSLLLARRTNRGLALRRV